MSKVLVVLATFPDRESARQIGTVLVEKQLAACVNISPGIESIYLWKEEIQQEEETLVIMKTTAARFGRLEAALREMHPYEVPEILALPVQAGSEAYLHWVCAGSGGD